MSGAAGGFFGSLGATAWGGAGGKWGGIAGKYAGSDVGTIAFGALSGGVGAELSGGNFWQGAIAGGIVAGLNDVMHKVAARIQLSIKYPGLFKTLSKLREYVKNNREVMEAFTTESGYSSSKTLKLLSIKKLLSIVKVGGTDENGEFFGDQTEDTFDPNHIHINQRKVESLDIGGFRSRAMKINENYYGTSFFVGLTVLHELVHFGRYWNGLPGLSGIYEAGQVFETKAFGQIQTINGATQSAKKNGW